MIDALVKLMSASGPGGWGILTVGMMIGVFGMVKLVKEFVEIVLKFKGQQNTPCTPCDAEDKIDRISEQLIRIDEKLDSNTVELAKTSVTSDDTKADVAEIKTRINDIDKRYDSLFDQSFSRLAKAESKIEVLFSRMGG